MNDGEKKVEFRNRIPSEIEIISYSLAKRKEMLFFSFFSHKVD